MLIYFSFLFAKSQIILQFQKAWMDIPLCGQLMQTPSLYKCFSNILQGERVVRDLSFLPCSRMSIAISVMNLIQKSHLLVFAKQYSIGKACSTLLSHSYFIINSINYVPHCQGQGNGRRSDTRWKGKGVCLAWPGWLILCPGFLCDTATGFLCLP